MKEAARAAGYRGSTLRPFATPDGNLEQIQQYKSKVPSCEGT